ncbi:MAG: hypothetical protein JO261_08480 [Alphaproteobacteria bacterium]|nr:hypothetical protein [Alphaproteobacteria bacterium]MBV9693723.1 hypothetical protein [Alphaproteobacteria bacterium]
MALRALARFVLLGALLSIASSAAQARHYSVLHSFSGSDGAGPQGDLALDSAGNLYGTTGGGGASAVGTIYKLSVTGTFTQLYSFTGGADGGRPTVGVTRDPGTGDLYGVTENGGAFGRGGIFKLTAAGVLVVLHDFNEFIDGYSPQATLTRDASGNLYGTTLLDTGTVFKLSADGSFHILHAFKGGDGAEPLGRLLLHGSDLYGTTTIGGTGSGTIFQLGLDGTYNVLYAPNLGAFMNGGLVRDRKGNLYGGYSTGPNGFIYALNPAGTMSPLHTFTGGDDGRFPNGDMLWSRRTHELYGATFEGGPHGNNGTVFKLDRKGNFTLLHGFSGAPADGTAPTGGLIKRNGTLYGTTSSGGSSNMGIVFAVSTR